MDDAQDKRGRISSLRIAAHLHRALKHGGGQGGGRGEDQPFIVTSHRRHHLRSSPLSSYRVPASLGFHFIFRLKGLGDPTEPIQVARQPLHTTSNNTKIHVRQLFLVY